MYAHRGPAGPLFFFRPIRAFDWPGARGPKESFSASLRLACRRPEISLPQPNDVRSPSFAAHWYDRTPQSPLRQTQFPVTFHISLPIGNRSGAGRPWSAISAHLTPAWYGQATRSSTIPNRIASTAAAVSRWRCGFSIWTTRLGGRRCAYFASVRLGIGQA